MALCFLVKRISKILWEESINLKSLPVKKCMNHYHTGWMIALESFDQNASPDFFPYSRKKIAEIINLECDMINKVTKKQLVLNGFDMF